MRKMADHVLEEEAAESHEHDQLTAGCARMAADTECEDEAYAWSESFIGDSFGVGRPTDNR